jgi:hypothetical protein
LKEDNLVLNRNYSGVDLNLFDEESIIKEIEEDFRVAYEGIVKLPIEAKFGVYSLCHYKKLLNKLRIRLIIKLELKE